MLGLCSGKTVKSKFQNIVSSNKKSKEQVDLVHLFRNKRKKYIQF